MIYIKKCHQAEKGADTCFCPSGRGYPIRLKTAGIIWFQRVFYVFIEANKFVSIILTLFEKGRTGTQGQANLFELSARTIYLLPQH